MALIVQKFGGTSVANPERIKNVAKRVARWKAMGHDIIVVPSAMSGETNRLLALAKEISPSPAPRELDVIASTGEQVTIGLLAMALQEEGVAAKSYTGPQVKVLTDSTFTKARILQIDDERMRKDLAEGKKTDAVKEFLKRYEIVPKANNQKNSQTKEEETTMAKKQEQTTQAQPEQVSQVEAAAQGREQQEPQRQQNAKAYDYQI